MLDLSSFVSKNNGFYGHYVINDHMFMCKNCFHTVPLLYCEPFIELKKNDCLIKAKAVYMVKINHDSLEQDLFMEAVRKTPCCEKCGNSTIFFEVGLEKLIKLAFEKELETWVSCAGNHYRNGIYFSTGCAYVGFGNIKKSFEMPIMRANYYKNEEDQIKSNKKFIDDIIDWLSQYKKGDPIITKYSEIN